MLGISFLVSQKKPLLKYRTYETILLLDDYFLDISQVTSFILIYKPSLNFTTITQYVDIWRLILPYHCCQCTVILVKSLQMKTQAKGKPALYAFMFLPIWCTNNFVKIGYM